MSAVTAARAEVEAAACIAAPAAPRPLQQPPLGLQQPVVARAAAGRPKMYSMCSMCGSDEPGPTPSYSWRRHRVTKERLCSLCVRKVWRSGTDQQVQLPPQQLPLQPQPPLPPPVQQQQQQQSRPPPPLAASRDPRPRPVAPVPQQPAQQQPPARPMPPHPQQAQRAAVDLSAVAAAEVEDLLLGLPTAAASGGAAGAAAASAGAPALHGVITAGPVRRSAAAATSAAGSAAAPPPPAPAAPAATYGSILAALERISTRSSAALATLRRYPAPPAHTSPLVLEQMWAHLTAVANLLDRLLPA